MHKTTKVKQLLNAICGTVPKHISYVNHGGCAVFAVIIAKKLEQLGYNDYKIRVYNQAYSNVNISCAEARVNGNTDMNEWHNNRVDFAHVVVEWKGMMWNAGHVTKRSNAKRWGWGLQLQRGSISMSAMSALASTQKGWNDTFDRKRSIPKLNKLVNALVAVHEI